MISIIVRIILYSLSESVLFTYSTIPEISLKKGFGIEHRNGKYLTYPLLFDYLID